MAGTGDAGYTSIEAMPGAAWWASLTAQAFSQVSQTHRSYETAMSLTPTQCAAAGCLAWLWGRCRPSGSDSHPLVMRACGTLPMFWAAMQLVATTETMLSCRDILVATARWWTPILLASSAFGEVLIAVACPMLLHRAMGRDSPKRLRLSLGVSGTSSVLRQIYVS